MTNKTIAVIEIAATLLITGGLVFTPTLAELLQITQAKSVL